MEYRAYRLADLPGIVAICRGERWPSLPSDLDRAHRLLTNPGVWSFVALDEGAVVGFAYLLSDGEVQTYLALMAVAATHHRRGVGSELIEVAFRGCGAERLDLLSSADAFYESFPHQQWTGFRLHPPLLRTPR